MSLKQVLQIGGLLLCSQLMNQTAWAKDCELEIEGNDAMQYNKKELVVEHDCTDIKVTLKDPGKLPKAAMGHDWTLTKEADMQAVVTAGLQAGAAADYMPKGDARVLASTKLVGGGESTSVSFKKSILKEGESYKYFCTFPGHSAVMNGKLVVK